MWIFNIDPLSLTSIFESIRELFFRCSFRYPVLIRLPVNDLEKHTLSPSSKTKFLLLSRQIWFMNWNPFLKSDQPQKLNSMFWTKPFSASLKELIMRVEKFNSWILIPSVKWYLIISIFTIFPLSIVWEKFLLLRLSRMLFVGGSFIKLWYSCVTLFCIITNNFHLFPEKGLFVTSVLTFSEYLNNIDQIY